MRSGFNAGSGNSTGNTHSKGVELGHIVTGQPAVLEISKVVPCSDTFTDAKTLIYYVSCRRRRS